MPKFQRKIFQKVFSLLNTEKIEKCQFYNAKFDSIKFLSPKYPIKKAYKINLFKVNLVLNKVDFW